MVLLIFFLFVKRTRKKNIYDDADYWDGQWTNGYIEVENKKQQQQAASSSRKSFHFIYRYQNSNQVSSGKLVRVKKIFCFSKQNNQFDVLSNV